MRVEVYSKPGCPLCEEALDVIDEVRSGLPPERTIELVVTNILEHPALWSQHRYDIPVVLVDGVIAWRHRVDPAELAQRLLLPARG